MGWGGGQNSEKCVRLKVRRVRSAPSIALRRGQPTCKCTNSGRKRRIKIGNVGTFLLGWGDGGNLTVEWAYMGEINWAKDKFPSTLSEFHHCYNPLPLFSPSLQSLTVSLSTCKGGNTTILPCLNNGQRLHRDGRQKAGVEVRYLPLHGVLNNTRSVIYAATSAVMVSIGTNCLLKPCGLVDSLCRYTSAECWVSLIRKLQYIQ